MEVDISKETLKRGMKITVLGGVTSYTVIESYEYFGCASIFRAQELPSTMKMEAANCSETDYMTPHPKRQ
jgi:hypothetical protein